VLLDTIVTQSDEQAEGKTVRELEALRDDCLVAVMHGLRTVPYGAGEVLDDYERMLFARSSEDPVRTDRKSVPDLALLPVQQADDLAVLDGQPLRLLTRSVPTDWIDYNGHVNDSRYLQLSSEAVDQFLRRVGIDEAYLSGGHSYYTVESHVNYLDQAHAGDQVAVDVVVLSCDDKRLHLFTSMYRLDDGPIGIAEDASAVDSPAGTLVATAEHMLLHVDTLAGKSSPAAPGLLAILASIGKAHRGIEAPQAGRYVGQR
jgi:carnitine 3-dehydrogenase